MLGTGIAFGIGVGVGVVCKDKLKETVGKVKECLAPTKARKSSNRYGDIHPRDSSNCATVVNGFSLQSISSVFSTYGVRLTNSGSFYLLMQKIESSCYKNLLKKFADNATSAEQLVNMLKDSLIPTFDVNINYSSQPPHIEEAKLDEYIIEEGSVPQEIGTAEHKVKFLLSKSYEHGIERFRNTLGAYLTEIIEASDKGEDVEALYKEIMRLIKSRYEYVS